MNKSLHIFPLLCFSKKDNFVMEFFKNSSAPFLVYSRVDNHTIFNNYIFIFWERWRNEKSEPGGEQQVCGYPKDVDKIFTTPTVEMKILVDQQLFI